MKEENTKKPIEYGRFLNINETKKIDEYLRRGYVISDTFNFEDSMQQDHMFVQMITCDPDRYNRVNFENRVQEDLKE